MQTRPELLICRGRSDFHNVSLKFQIDTGSPCVLRPGSYDPSLPLKLLFLLFVPEPSDAHRPSESLRHQVSKPRRTVKNLNRLVDSTKCPPSLLTLSKEGFLADTLDAGSVLSPSLKKKKKKKMCLFNFVTIKHRGLSLE